MAFKFILDKNFFEEISSAGKKAALESPVGELYQRKQDVRDGNYDGEILKELFIVNFYENYKQLKKGTKNLVVRMEKDPQPVKSNENKVEEAKGKEKEEKEKEDKEKEKEQENEEEEKQGKEEGNEGKIKNQQIDEEKPKPFTKLDEQGINDAIASMRKYKIETLMEGLENVVCFLKFISNLLDDKDSTDQEKKFILGALWETLENICPDFIADQKIKNIKKIKLEQVQHLIFILTAHLYILPFHQDEYLLNSIQSLQNIGSVGKEVHSNFLFVLNKTILAYFVQNIPVLNGNNNAEGQSESQNAKSNNSEANTESNRIRPQENVQSSVNLTKTAYHLYKTSRHLMGKIKTKIFKPNQDASASTFHAKFIPGAANNNKTIRALTELSNSSNENLIQELGLIKNAIILLINKATKENPLTKEEITLLNHYYYYLRVIENISREPENKLSIEVEKALQEIDKLIFEKINPELAKHLAKAPLAKKPEQELTKLKEDLQNILKGNFKRSVLLIPYPQGLDLADKVMHEIQNSTSVSWCTDYIDTLENKLFGEGSENLAKKSKKFLRKHLELVHQQLNDVNSPYYFQDPRTTKFDLERTHRLLFRCQSIAMLEDYRSQRKRSWRYFMYDINHDNASNNIDKSSRINTVNKIIADLKNCKTDEQFYDLAVNIAQIYRNIPDESSYLKNILVDITNNIYFLLNTEAIAVKKINAERGNTDNKEQNMGEEQNNSNLAPNTVDSEASKNNAPKIQTTFNYRKKTLHVLNQNIFNLELKKNLGLPEDKTAYRQERILQLTFDLKKAKEKTALSFSFRFLPYYILSKGINRIYDFVNKKTYHAQTDQQYQIILALNQFLESKYNFYKEKGDIAEFYTLYIEYCATAIENVSDIVLKEKLKQNIETVINRFIIKPELKWPHFTEEQLSRIEAVAEEQKKPSFMEKTKRIIQQPKNSADNSDKVKMKEARQVSYDNFIKDFRESNKNAEQQKKEELFINTLKTLMIQNQIGSKSVASGLAARAETPLEKLLKGAESFGKSIPFGGDTAVKLVTGAAGAAVQSSEETRIGNMSNATIECRDIDVLADVTARKVALMYSHYISHVVDQTSIVELATCAFKSIEAGLVVCSGDLATKSDQLAAAVRNGSTNFSVGGLMKSRLILETDALKTFDKLHVEAVFNSYYFMVIKDNGESPAYYQIAGHKVDDSKDNEKIENRGFAIVHESQLEGLHLEPLVSLEVGKLFKDEKEKTQFETKAKANFRDIKKSIETFDKNNEPVKKLEEKVVSLEEQLKKQKEKHKKFKRQVIEALTKGNVATFKPKKDKSKGTGAQAVVPPVVDNDAANDNDKVKVAKGAK